MKAKIVHISDSVTKQRSGTIADLLNCIVVIDREGVILDVNEYVTAMGKSRRKLLLSDNIGESILLHPAVEAEPYVKVKIESLIAGNSFTGLQVNGMLPGTCQKFWARCFGVNCRGYCIVGFEDITQQKLLESESLGAVQKFQALFENHPGGVFCFDANGFILEVNNGSCKVSGYNTDELIGRNFSRFFIRQDLPTIVASAQRVFRGKPAHFEARFIRKDGNKIHLFVTFIPITDKAHIDGYYGIALDITERKRLSKLIRSLKEEYEDLFENAPMGLFSGCLDNDGEYVISRLNRKASSIFGYHRDELYRLPLTQLVSDEDQAGLTETFEDNIKSQAQEVLGLRKDGTTFPAWVSVDAQEDQRFIIAVDDISLRKEMEATQARLIQELKDSHHALERKSKLQQLVLRMLGHDFRSPFNSILGGARLLMELGLTDEQRELVDIIHRSATHELKLIDNLLKFSHIEERNIRFNVEPVSAHVIAHEIKVQHGEEAKKKHIKLIVDQVDSVYFKVDLDLLMRNVVGNIVHNAIKYSYPGQEVSIHVLKDRDGFGVIQVQDKGIGIPEELLPYIFDINLTKNRMGTQKEKSTGFGLYIASQMAKMMGGQVDVETVPDKGTLMTLRVPLALQARHRLPRKRSRAHDLEQSH